MRETIRAATLFFTFGDITAVGIVKTSTLFAVTPTAFFVLRGKNDNLFDN
jgi:hypothetical protein